MNVYWYLNYEIYFEYICRTVTSACLIHMYIKNSMDNSVPIKICIYFS